MNSTVFYCLVFKIVKIGLYPDGTGHVGVIHVDYKLFTAVFLLSQLNLTFLPVSAHA